MKNCHQCFVYTRSERNSDARFALILVCSTRNKKSLKKYLSYFLLQSCFNFTSFSQMRQNQMLNVAFSRFFSSQTFAHSFRGKMLTSFFVYFAGFFFDTQQFGEIFFNANFRTVFSRKNSYNLFFHI